MLCTLGTKEDSRKMMLEEESLGLSPVGAGSQGKKRRKNTYSTVRRRDLRGFTPHIDWFGFLKFDLIKIGFLQQPAAACLLPHTYTKAIQSGLSYCSIFPCFIFNSVSSSSSRNNSCTALSFQTHFPQRISDSCGISSIQR